MTILSKYPRASIKELLHISLPLMLTMMSQNLMFFADRFILSQLSIDAMNAASIAGMLCYVISYGGIAIASIAEVFVAQKFGAKKNKKVAQPVWQMIWFSLSLFIISIPLALFSGPLLLSENLYDLSIIYYQPMMLALPLPAINVALSAFFIGRGQSIIVTQITILVNIINIILNIILVFGISGIIEPMGIFGSAIATIIAELVSISMLLYLFLKKENNEKFMTHKYNINLKMIKRCFKIGGPSAISHILEIGAWTAIMYVLAAEGKEYLTIYNIGQNFFVLFTFIAQALQKAVTTITANLIGSDNKKLIGKLLNSSVRLYLLIMAILAVILLIYPDVLAAKFLNVHSTILDATIISLRWLWLFILLDGLQWIIAGILTAGGDTMFIMYASTLNSWLLGFAPIVIAMHFFHISITLIWPLLAFYSLVSLIMFSYRYKKKQWIKLDLSTS